ncbi:VOC family protein [Planosporangium mesophilum]|uniref:Glyoxalase n=1 Tax=Planosporangium mesophilum TaxID=689768 RepID=A0A8J3WZN5_9ACTN|nr:VOC family protein [Planosporangium mesophilum]NJC82998.1 VOC family protein [Planosporangium mesophilum]GII22402.1 glyoxalase [Planosporangium mesophilum]
MPVHRLNHAVLYVSDVERSAAFYRDTLGFRTTMAFPDAIFLAAPGSTSRADLGLFQADPEATASRGPARRGAVGLYHLAWEVDTLAELERLAGILANAGALVGATDHGVLKSLYAKDADGIEFSVVWVVPEELLDDAPKQVGTLDIGKEKARYGAETRGGVAGGVPVTD